MTLTEVEQAKAAIEADGRYASIEATREHLRRGSRRDIARHLQTLRAASPPVTLTPATTTEATPAPAPSPASGPAPVSAPDGDPAVLAAAAVLKEAQASFVEARDTLVAAKLTLLAARPLLIDGVLYGSLHPADELHQDALSDVQAAKRTYDEAWQARDAARRQLAQLEQEYRRGQQEQWVSTHQPALVETLEHWREKLRTARTDRDHAQAKKEYSQALHTWQQEVFRAPYSTNGATRD